MTFNKTLLFLSLILCIGCSSARPTQQTVQQASSPDAYNVTLDLTTVKNDKVQVTVMPPAIKQDEVIYNMPKIVPGTYSISDFGKFVTDLKAYDTNGRELKVVKLDTNRWKISNATTLHHISYWADDTFDTPKREDAVFEPGGTNIEDGKNFLLNPFGFVGYFDELKQMPYELTIKKPAGFYGSTALKTIATTDSTDTYRLPNYVDLADSPLMYNKPDTTFINIGGAQVLVSVYSPSGRVTSEPIAANINDILEAQRQYLGGTLPVDKYAFLIYVPEKVGKTGSYGALEHSYSSVYFLPEMPADVFSSTIRDVAAHEFFHIVTPLNIHSEEIGNFDFINPKMSKHLWMYEGVTEYFATHVQVYEDLIPTEEFLAKIREYIATSRSYYNDTLPFTEMSANVLTIYEKEYGNVYQKGALIGLVLDIRLRELSGGKTGLRDLMLELSKTYGKENAFKDDELFDKIAELTSSEIREFFAKYVEGAEPLPLEETFEKVGITYLPQSRQQVVSYGGFAPGYDQDAEKISIASTADMDAFGRRMGFKEGDLLLKWNGTEINPMNVRELIGEELQKMKPGSQITVTVGRKDAKGKMTEKVLKGKVEQVERQVVHLLQVDPNATEQQKALRAAWLNNEVL